MEYAAPHVEPSQLFILRLATTLSTQIRIAPTYLTVTCNLKMRMVDWPVSHVLKACLDIVKSQFYQNCKVPVLQAGF